MRNKGALFVCLDKVEGDVNSLKFFYGCSVTFQLFFFLGRGGPCLASISMNVSRVAVFCAWQKKNSRESDNDVTWSQSNFVTFKSTPCSSLH